MDNHKYPVYTFFWPIEADIYVRLKLLKKKSLRENECIQFKGYDTGEWEYRRNRVYIKVAKKGDGKEKIQIRA